MCGLVGLFGACGAELSNVLHALTRVAHRGPDGHGLHAGPGTLLAHRRLSILGGSRGQQPLYNEAETVAVVYNGEIYNHQGLRRRLSRTHALHSTSDGEVLSHLYEDEGPSFVSRLRGMFALALTDGNRLLLARDPVGI
ncbi:MAG: asparagine synthetase B, partial [Candidatus Eremiobacterota bacterium]